MTLYLLGPVIYRAKKGEAILIHKKAPSAVLKLPSKKIRALIPVTGALYVVTENGEKEKFSLFIAKSAPQEVLRKASSAVVGAGIDPEEIVEKVKEIFMVEDLSFEAPKEVIRPESSEIFELEKGGERYTFVAISVLGKDKEGKTHRYFCVRPKNSKEAWIWLKGQPKGDVNVQFVYVGPFHSFEISLEEGKIRAGSFLFDPERLRAVRRKGELFWLGISVSPAAEEDWQIIAKSSLPPEDSVLEDYLCAFDGDKKIHIFKAKGNEEEFSGFEIPPGALIGKKIYVLGETKKGIVIAYFDPVKICFEGPFYGKRRGTLWICGEKVSPEEALEFEKIRVVDIGELVHDFVHYKWALKDFNIDLLVLAKDLLHEAASRGEIGPEDYAFLKRYEDNELIKTILRSVEEVATPDSYLVYCDLEGRIWLLRQLTPHVYEIAKRLGWNRGPKKGFVWEISEGKVRKIYKALQNGTLIRLLRCTNAPQKKGEEVMRR